MSQQIAYALTSMPQTFSVSAVFPCAFAQAANGMFVRLM